MESQPTLRTVFIVIKGRIFRFARVIRSPRRKYEWFVSRRRAATFRLRDRLTDNGGNDARNYRWAIMRVGDYAMCPAAAKMYTTSGWKYSTEAFIHINNASAKLLYHWTINAIRDLLLTTVLMIDRPTNCPSNRTYIVWTDKFALIEPVHVRDAWVDRAWRGGGCREGGWMGVAGEWSGEVWLTLKLLYSTHSSNDGAFSPYHRTPL